MTRATITPSLRHLLHAATRATLGLLLLAAALGPAAPAAATGAQCSAGPGAPAAAPHWTGIDHFLSSLTRPAVPAERAESIEAVGCYWRDFVDCGGYACSWRLSCWLASNGQQPLGYECWGRRVEYCDGVPSGSEEPIARLYCGYPC